MNLYTRNKWSFHVRWALVGGACVFAAILLLVFTQVLTQRYSRAGFRIGIGLAGLGAALIVFNHLSRPKP